MIMFVLINLVSRSQSFQTPNQPYNLSFSFRSTDGKNVVSSRDYMVITNSRVFCYGLTDNAPNLWIESSMPSGTFTGVNFVYRRN